MPPAESENDRKEQPKGNSEEIEEVEEVEDDEEDDEEEEPRLKYTRLTRTLGGVYRNGDAVASSLVFGERMVCLAFWRLITFTHLRLLIW